MKKSVRRAVFSFLLVGGFLSITSTVVGAATIINFDGLTNGQLVGNAFSGQGVTFDRATVFGDPFDSSGFSPPNAILSNTPQVGTALPGSVFGQSDAIVATFNTAIDAASIVALSVGFNGARIDAFDQLVGGTLLASDEAFGLQENGLSEFFVLSVSAPGIRRLELFQPSSGFNDGLAFDTLTINSTPVPEPSALLLLGTGLVGLVGYGRRKRKA